MADLDLAAIRKECITSLYLCTDNVSKFLETEKDAEFAKLKSFVEEYCLLEAQQNVAFEALEKAKNESNASNIESLDKRFSTYLSSMASTRHRTNHPYMLEMDKKIQRGQAHAGDNLDESDLAITESQEKFIDPITKKPIQDPVRNTLCGHVYEREAIFNLMKMKKGTRCPMAGCGNRDPIHKNNLVSDEELKFRMALTQHSTMIQERSIMDLDE